MKFCLIVVLVFICTSCYANMDITYEVDEGNLHIRYQTGGWEDRGGKMEALFGLLKYAEKNNYFKEPTLVYLYEFIPSDNSGTYKVGYGNFQYQKDLDTIVTKGFSFFFTVSIMT